MRIAVLDTSTLVRLYVPDGPIPEGAEASIEAAWNGRGVTLVPELALAEFAGVMRKKEARGEIAGEFVDRAIDELRALPLTVVGHRELLHDATRFARSSAVTVYDGLFVALAVARDAPLITADERQRRAWLAATAPA